MKCDNCYAINDINSSRCVNCGKEFNNLQNGGNINNINPPKKKNILPIILVVVFLILLISGIGGYIYFTRPINKFTNMINSFSKELENALITDDNQGYEFSITSRISGYEDEKFERIINSFDLTVSEEIDYTNQEMISTIKLLYDNESMFEIKAEYKEDIYVVLNDLYDSVIKVDNELNGNELFDNKECYSYIMKAFVKAFNSSLVSDYFTEENGASVLNLSEVRIAYIFNNMVDILVNDNEFVENYGELIDYSNDEVIELFNSLKASNTDINELNDETICKIFLYTEGLKQEFSKLVISYENIKISIVKEADSAYKFDYNYEDMTVGFDISYRVLSNELSLTDVSDYVNIDDVDYKDILNNLLDNEAFINFSNDYEEVDGINLEEVLRVYITDTNSNANKQLFAFDANTVIEAAGEYFIFGSLTGGASLPKDEGEVKCVTVDTLIDLGYLELDDTYTGKVLIKKYNNFYLYSLYLYDENYMVEGAGLNDTYTANVDVVEIDVLDYSSLNVISGSTCDVMIFPGS